MRNKPNDLEKYDELFKQRAEKKEELQCLENRMTYLKGVHPDSLWGPDQYRSPAQLLTAAEYSVTSAKAAIESLNDQMERIKLGLLHHTLCPPPVKTTHTQETQTNETTTSMH